MANHYRLGVGIVVLNANNQVFVAQRLDNPGQAWQMPQGGLDRGEDPCAAAFRELEEETSIKPSSVEIIAETQDWLDYDLPDFLRAKLWGGRFKGQRQKWYLMRFSGDDSQINIKDVDHPEFSEWKWTDFDTIVDFIVPFKKPMYEKIYSAFRDKISQA